MITRILRHGEIDEAARLLRQGELVAFPTETVYGLGADATNDSAASMIFAVKVRPSFNPLITHVADWDAARALVEVDERARLLAERFWPGPLSLVLKRRPDCPISQWVSAGLETLAIRIPAHPLALDLLRAVGRPLAAPSANRSGHVSPTTVQHVLRELEGRIPAVLDGGPCAVGVESTVLDLTGERPVQLRSGGVTREELEALLGPIDEPALDGERRSPGMLLSHYAPSLPVRLDATGARPGEALLAFGPNPPPGFAQTLSLSESGDLREAAARLYASLRALDRPEFTGIAVMPIPERGLGAAINDRLRRASYR
jgi:L-threonylcarbamoyladenylate synthase